MAAHYMWATLESSPEASKCSCYGVNWGKAFQSCFTSVILAALATNLFPDAIQGASYYLEIELQLRTVLRKYEGMDG